MPVLSKAKELVKAEKVEIEEKKIELRETVIEDLSVMFNQVMLSYYKETGVNVTQAEMVHALANIAFHWGKLTAKKEIAEEQDKRIESGRGMTIGFGAGG